MVIITPITCVPRPTRLDTAGGANHWPNRWPVTGTAVLLPAKPLKEMVGPGELPSHCDSNDLFCPAGTNAGFETKRQFPQLSSLESGSGQRLRPGFGGLHPGEHHSHWTHSQKREKTDLPQAAKPEAFEFIPGPKLRAKLGISAVTLWRWRHDKKKGFPVPKVINGRLYFALGAVMAWLARQADAA